MRGRERRVSIPAAAGADTRSRSRSRLRSRRAGRDCACVDNTARSCHIRSRVCCFLILIFLINLESIRSSRFKT